MPDITINKAMIAFITLLILLSGILLKIGLILGDMQTRIAGLEKQTNEYINMQKDITRCEIRLSLVEEKFTYIKENIEEIKIDMKDIKKNIEGNLK